MVPVRKFSMTTSASFTSRLTTSTASGVFRSSAMPRLFRLKSRYAAASPSLWGGQVRDSSPGPVSSTLMTSAPRSASSAPHQGPAMTRERSMTRMPSRESDEVGKGGGHGAYYTAVGGVYSPSPVHLQPSPPSGGSAHGALRRDDHHVLGPRLHRRAAARRDPVQDPRPRALRPERRQPPGLEGDRGARPQDPRGPGRRHRARGQALRGPGAGRREPVEHHRPHPRGRGHHRADPAARRA